jgi:tRNA dimethylallyltransferase
MERALTVLADPLLVGILGPTGSGKTALSLALAERLQGEIVSCDSVAMYRELEIGTAKPSRAERARVPHHLVDCLNPADVMTAGEYGRQARAVLEVIKSRGRLPIVVGGTGLYLRALVDGLFLGPQRSEGLRARLRQAAGKKRQDYLQRMLARLDPEAAARIHANDTPKLIRAIEVCLTARAPITEIWKGASEPLRGFRIFRIGLNPERSALYQRLNKRAEQMFAAGLVEETRDLLAKYGPAEPLNSLGYKQAAQLLRGELQRPQALAAVQQAHRNYAKRQLTWFRREPNVFWIDGFGDEEKVQSIAASEIGKLSQADRPAES